MSVLAVISTALLVTGVVLWSATRSDHVTQDRQRQIVAYALARSVEKIPYDQENVANWDDAVVNVRNAFDPKWIDVNLGVWMYDYFKHDRVYILDAGNRVLYAMADGKRAPASGALPGEVLENLVATLRREIDGGALDRYEAGQERIPRAVDLAVVDERPAIISVMPLLPHSAAVVQARGTECLTLSIRFLDSSFLPDLADAYLLKGVRFSRSDDVASNEQSLPLKTKAGVFIGNFVWAPDLPGWKILSHVLPVFALGLAVIGIAIAFLIRSLRRTYTDLTTSEAQSRHLAFHDGLTGLPNRAFFNARLEKALEDVRSGQSQMALMFLDLDRFKQVNDTLGHAAGDELIRILAARLGAALGPDDVLARMGGDEFAIIKANIRDHGEIEDFCHQIIRAVSMPFDVLGSQAVVGMSVGVAMSPEAGVDRSELASKADIALYRAKNSGRQRFQFFTEGMSEIIRERQALEFELRQALGTGNGLEVVYQPVFAANSLTIVGVEALVRWTHPRLGAISPLVVIGLAEESGLICQLGDWVLREACRAAQLWGINTIAVNVSPVQFRQPDFAEGVLALLLETGLPPDRLEIELTETALLDGAEASSAGLKALREAGVRFALDDFGTGYSSLSYLMKLEVDRIKIDHSFVRHLDHESQTLSIVQAIVTMAHAVGVTVTAEGVETVKQQEILTLIGCNDLQGYLFSEPLSALRLTELIARGELPSIPKSWKAA